MFLEMMDLQQDFSITSHDQKLLKSRFKVCEKNYPVLTKIVKKMLTPDHQSRIGLKEVFEYLDQNQIKNDVYHDMNIFNEDKFFAI